VIENLPPVFWADDQVHTVVKADEDDVTLGGNGSHIPPTRRLKSVMSSFNKPILYNLL
jgi:hypothetical protein